MRLILSCAAALVLTATASRAAEPADDLAAVAAKASSTDQGLGLVLGDVDGKLTAALARATRMHVQALAADQKQAEAVRLALEASGPAGRTSAVWRRTRHLPYLDNLINVVVAVGPEAAGAKAEALAEIARVLRPGGVAVVGSDAGTDGAALLAEAGKVKLAKAETLPRNGAWIRITKLMDPDFGEWSSYAGGPEMAMVSGDKALTPGKEVRWYNGPSWSTGSTGNIVIAGGRAFYREAQYVGPNLKEPSRFVGRWTLVARDAFNGCDLWRESVPQGRPQVLCADDKYVYNGENRDLVQRDAATGKLVRSYPDVMHATVLGNSLILGGKVVDRDSGKTLWSRPDCIAHPAARDGTAYLLTGAGAEAVALADGKSQWKTPLEALKDCKGGQLMAKGGNVYLVQGIGEGFRFLDDPAKKRHLRVTALDRANGQLLWSQMWDQPGHSVLTFDDAVWISKRVGNFNEHVLLDARTGKQAKVVRGTVQMGSHCWGPRATERFAFFDIHILMDRKSGESFSRSGVRSTCGTGQFPAYGLEYNTQHPCNCDVSLRGCAALSGGSAMPKGEVAPALVRGPGAPGGAPAAAGDWPVHRADPARSNAYSGELPGQLKKLWAVKVGSGAVPQATGAGNLVFAADSEGHRVVALAADTGKQAWSFTTEGRVSIAPTYHKGTCLFGDGAGWVYCVGAADGRLIWQLQAAPEQRYMSATNQLESSWPVKSGVLVLEDQAFFIAGRISTMEGGLSLFGVDAATGQERWKRKFTDTRPTDLLVSDGKLLYFTALRISPADGRDNKTAPASTTPLLQFGWNTNAGISILDLFAAAADPLQSRDMKSLLSDNRAKGLMIAFTPKQSVAWWVANGELAKNFGPPDRRSCLVSVGSSAWTNKDTGQQITGLVLAGSRVYAAGVPEVRDGQGAPALWVFAAADGKELQKIQLESVLSIDGLSAVGGKLILTTADGQVICFGAQ
ncbi:MAG TPA: PQQ-binding-like beta-propeller repeat protein [Planctomycetota bacterium]|nr:PQQ-binding-like beta-propeller repeat protein [Planctomycetota bacterium]